MQERAYRVVEVLCGGGGSDADWDESGVGVPAVDAGERTACWRRGER